MSGNYNFLILDEPTNHLDLASREVLEDALKDYPGTVLIVSHDRYFLDKVIDYIYELENQELNKYFGDYSYYKEKKKNEISEQLEKEKEEEKSEGKLDYEAQKEARSREMKRQKRLEEIESDIEKLEKDLNYLEDEMTAEKNIDKFEILQELKDEYESKNNKLEKLYQEWETLI